MKKLIVLLRNSLGLMLKLGVEKMGIVRYAFINNPLLDGCRGVIDGMVLFNRAGKQMIRCRPRHFNIKDPEYWKGRMDRFRDCGSLCKEINFELENLYEFKPEKKTYLNLLMSQCMKFWAGGPAPAPYTFAPGTANVEIGNGSMPDAREVVFTPQSGGKLQIAWDTECDYPTERPDDTLQIMVIARDGKHGFWIPMISADDKEFVERKDGKYLLTLPEIYLNPATDMEVYCAVKFKAGTGKVNGVFRFPVGIKAITLIP